MGLSVNEFTYSGDDQFDLNFAMGYTSRSDITAYIPGDPVVDLSFDWLTDSKVILSPGHGLNEGDTLVFRRTVSKLSPPVDLSQPGMATRESLERNYKHVMYMIHELLDNRTADTFPWELVGGVDELAVIASFPYLETYTTAKES